jgi:3-hydroxyacyl-CoA dehydrogenase/3a,7a,12a-trihydroxy-5b-cholest-24-enoyl-CoA hydratase
MGDYVARNSDEVSKIGVIYQFKITDPDSVWTLDTKNGKGSVTEGESAKPECTLELSEADFLDMTQGKADPQKLYFAGKLKISGNVMASQKLTFLQKVDPEQAKEAVLKARAAKASGGGNAPAKAAAKAKEASAPMLFDKLGSLVGSDASLLAKVAASMQWNVTGPDAVWSVDLREGKGKVAKGELAGADATFTISDDDLLALAKGESSAKLLFQQGKLRVDGDISVAHRLDFLKSLL